MSYVNSAVDYQALPKTPGHKMGTKEHKNFGARPASFTDKIGSDAAPPPGARRCA
jgi:hypothetical protein